MNARKLFTIGLLVAVLVTACGTATPTATQPPAPTQAPATQAPATQAPATQAPATQAPVATTAPVKLFRIAVIMPSATNDAAFSQSMWSALQKIQSDMGGPTALELAYTEGL